jgi:hypothetical protein
MIAPGADSILYINLILYDNPLDYISLPGNPLVLLLHYLYDVQQSVPLPIAEEEELC